MPELPEVETIAKELNEALPGQKIKKTEVFRANAIEPTQSLLLGKKQGSQNPQEKTQPDLPRAFAEMITGRRFGAVTRRGKYLLFELVPDLYLVGHLRMTGKFIVSPPPQQRPPHHRVWFGLEDGLVLAFQDMRCFGKLALVEKPETYAPLSQLGMEPLDRSFTPTWLNQALSKSQTPLKHWLMNQHNLAGLGNIYVAEILHRAGLSPLRPANELTAPDIKKLHKQIKSVLREAIQHNGTTISDFRRVDDKTGAFQNFLRVYGKAGTDCPKCKGTVTRIRQQQRSTYYCPDCQT